MRMRAKRNDDPGRRREVGVFFGVFLILEMFAVKAVQHATVTHMGIHIRDY